MNDVLITKASLKKDIIDHHGKEVKKKMGGLEESRKLYSIKQDDFSEVQEYFKEKSVERVRMAFNLVISKFRKNCDKGMIMTQSHCLKCPALEEMREGLELSNIMDMVTFFRRVLEERARFDSLRDVS